MGFEGPAEAATAATPKPGGPGFLSLKRERESKAAGAAAVSSQQGTVASTPPASDDDNYDDGDQNGRAEATREESDLPPRKRARSALSAPSETSLKPESPVMVLSRIRI